MNIRRRRNDIFFQSLYVILYLIIYLDQNSLGIQQCVFKYDYSFFKNSFFLFCEFLQLAVATADLALQFVGWEKPVEDVVNKYEEYLKKI